MKSKYEALPVVLLVAAMVVSACAPLAGGPKEKTVFVGPYLVDCEGVAPQKCMLVKEDAKDDWTLFYDQIQGFEYEPGFEYELVVQEDKVENPPAVFILDDCFSKRRELLSVIETYRVFKPPHDSRRQSLFGAVSESYMQKRRRQVRLFGVDRDEGREDLHGCGYGQTGFFVADRACRILSAEFDVFESPAA